ncbi:MAG: ABC transporter permease, partial [Rhodothermales bacterium]
GSPPRIVIGADLARLLNVDVGDTVTAFSMQGASAETPTPRLRQFVVSGVYATFLQNFDELYVLLDIETAATFFDYGPNEFTRLDVTLDDPDRADEIVARIEQSFGFPVMARTIREVYRGLFAWIALQQNIIPIVISVIVLVAAFNIIATLMMLILEKTREIGVMGSLGVSKASIHRLFVLLGLFIGAIGAGIGSVIAFLTAIIQQRFGIIPLPAEAYYIDRAPIDMAAFDFVLVSAVAITLCLMAAYLPARVAARIDPVRAIRLQ